MYGRAYYLVRRKWKEMYCVYPHGLRIWHDWRKLTFFLFSMPYVALLLSRQMPNRRDAVRAFPLLVLTQVVWKAGMVAQMLKEKRRPSRDDTARQDREGVRQRIEIS